MKTLVVVVILALVIAIIILLPAKHFKRTLQSLVTAWSPPANWYVVYFPLCYIAALQAWSLKPCSWACYAGTRRHAVNSHWNRHSVVTGERQVRACKCEVALMLTVVPVQPQPHSARKPAVANVANFRYIELAYGSFPELNEISLVHISLNVKISRKSAYNFSSCSGGKQKINKWRRKTLPR